MALNGNLNGVLSNIVDNRSPVIRLSNGLYTLIDRYSIIPNTNLGTNFNGRIEEYCITEDEIIDIFKLLGTWDSNAYFYDQNTGWYIISR